MNRSELLELIRSGENHYLEFRRDSAENHDLAKDLVAFLNAHGGSVLLGVGDDGEISGTRRENLEDWVKKLFRTQIEPPIIPILSWTKNAAADRDVLSISVPHGPDKPYARVHRGRNTYYIRVGNTSREESQEELQRMYPGNLRYGMQPVPGATFDALDHRRLQDYFVRILDGEAPDPDNRKEWESLLRNINFMVDSPGQSVATVDGMLLFGRAPNRYLPQSGIRAICYAGSEPNCATRIAEQLYGPMTLLGTANGSLAESGLVEQSWDFVRRNTMPSAHLEGARRIDRWEYPESVFREAIVNALIHRDYSIAGTAILLAIYSDRLEIQSPGRLPNAVTAQKMKAGLRYRRNQTLLHIMRDYGYVDVQGMGVRKTMIPGMRAHNGTEPDLIAEDDQFTVRLWKEAKR